MKYIKKGSRVNTRCVVPKDAEWKLLSLVLKDLELEPELDRKVSAAIRSRSLVLLETVLNDLQPRRIIESFGIVDKSKACDFFKKYQLGCFLKKFPFKNGKDTKAKALQKFAEAERQCKVFNEENHLALCVLSEKHPDYVDILTELRNDISDCLGEVPNDSCISDHAMHGPGVSIGDSYKDGCCTSYFKYASLPYSVTQSTLALARSAIEADARWLGALDNWYRIEYSIPFTQPKNLEDFWAKVFKVVDCSRITTVPKTFLTDRTIAIEPLMNVYFQLGLDRILRRRIRNSWGYDLNSQERNQSLAKLGSITGELSTLDLSAASDTISLKIVELLLPAEWYNLLMDLRSPSGILQTEDGFVKVNFEKLSSMGNGYTFAIETLIFGAIARCAIRRTNSERKSSVYGDDIIVPTTACRYCMDLLRLCGFAINEDKSFVDGPFRESCGQDFFLGEPVRPIFLKRSLDSVQSLIYLYNSFTLLEDKCPWYWEVSFPNTKAKILSWIPKGIQDQFFGPVSESLDTHLFLNRRLHSKRLGDYVYRFYYKLTPQPIIYLKRNSDFFFRKLMNQLKGENSEPRKMYKWDVKRKMSTGGNAFNVVKRDHLHFTCTRCLLPEGRTDPAYLTSRLRA